MKYSLGCRIKFVRQQVFFKLFRGVDFPQNRYVQYDRIAAIPAHGSRPRKKILLDIGLPENGVKVPSTGVISDTR